MGADFVVTRVSAGLAVDMCCGFCQAPDYYTPGIKSVGVETASGELVVLLSVTNLSKSISIFCSLKLMT